MEYFLIDNGSLRSGSILEMRKIAHNLSVSSGHLIRPFGLMHSHKVDPRELEGVPGDSMQNFLLSEEQESIADIRALPFFLGPSLAITDWLPENLAAWKEKRPGHRSYRILKPLYQSGDDRLARAMSDLCIQQIKNSGFVKPHVALVDHGTPLPSVNLVREKVGDEMRKIIASKISGFSTCAMERRPAPKYDFNNPLLENLLGMWMQNGVKEVIVSQFFLLPGRHAGPDGDLAEICKPFIEGGMKIERTQNLGNHPLVHEILRERIQVDQETTRKSLGNQENTDTK